VASNTDQQNEQSYTYRITITHSYKYSIIALLRVENDNVELQPFSKIRRNRSHSKICRNWRI